MIPTFTACVIAGCYKFAAVQTDITGVFTNKFTTDAIRGAGRPEGTYLIELTMDALADELGIDRLELRRKNFITEFPQRDAARLHLRLGQLRRDARPLPGDARPRRVPARAGRAARARRLPRRGLLDLRRDLRARPVARARAEGLGHAGRLLRVGPGARAPDRLGHRLHGHVAARPGARDELRADRRRPARRRPGRHRRDPRRHEHRALRQEHLRLAVARGRGRGGRTGRREGTRQGEADRRAQPRGRARGHRARRGLVPGRRLAGEGDDARGGRGRGLHPRGAARGHGGGAGRDLVLRPVELRLAVRRPRVHQRGRRRDGTRRRRPLYRGRRLRTGDQPAADRRADPRRARARARPGALRAGRLRRGRPARHRHVRRLHDPERRRRALVRDRPHGDSVADQHARRQGRRRGARRSPARPLS